jgi:hypothetical protein
VEVSRGILVLLEATIPPSHKLVLPFFSFISFLKQQQPEESYLCLSTDTKTRFFNLFQKPSKILLNFKNFER